MICLNVVGICIFNLEGDFSLHSLVLENLKEQSFLKHGLTLCKHMSVEKYEKYLSTGMTQSLTNQNRESEC